MYSCVDYHFESIQILKDTPIDILLVNQILDINTTNTNSIPKKRTQTIITLLSNDNENTSNITPLCNFLHEKGLSLDCNAVISVNAPKNNAVSPSKPSPRQSEDKTTTSPNKLQSFKCKLVAISRLHLFMIQVVELKAISNIHADKTNKVNGSQKENVSPGGVFCNDIPSDSVDNSKCDVKDAIPVSSSVSSSGSKSHVKNTIAIPDGSSNNHRWSPSPVTQLDSASLRKRQHLFTTPALTINCNSIHSGLPHVDTSKTSAHTPVQSFLKQIVSPSSKEQGVLELEELSSSEPSRLTHNRGGVSIRDRSIPNISVCDAVHCDVESEASLPVPLSTTTQYQALPLEQYDTTSSLSNSNSTYDSVGSNLSESDCNIFASVPHHGGLLRSPHSHSNPNMSESSTQDTISMEYSNSMGSGSGMGSILFPQLQYSAGSGINTNTSSCGKEKNPSNMSLFSTVMLKTNAIVPNNPINGNNSTGIDSILDTNTVNMSSKDTSTTDVLIRDILDGFFVCPSVPCGDTLENSNFDSNIREPQCYMNPLLAVNRIVDVILHNEDLIFESNTTDVNAVDITGKDTQSEVHNESMNDCTNERIRRYNLVLSKLKERNAVEKSDDEKKPILKMSNKLTNLCIHLIQILVHTQLMSILDLENSSKICNTLSSIDAIPVTKCKTNKNKGGTKHTMKVTPFLKIVTRYMNKNLEKLLLKISNTLLFYKHFSIYYKDVKKYHLLHNDAEIDKVNDVYMLSLLIVEYNRDCVKEMHQFDYMNYQPKADALICKKLLCEKYVAMDVLLRHTFYQVAKRGCGVDTMACESTNKNRCTHWLECYVPDIQSILGSHESESALSDEDEVGGDADGEMKNGDTSEMSTRTPVVHTDMDDTLMESKINVNVDWFKGAKVNKNSFDLPIVESHDAVSSNVTTTSNMNTPIENWSGFEKNNDVTAALDRKQSTGENSTTTDNTAKKLCFDAVLNKKMGRCESEGSVVTKHNDMDASTDNLSDVMNAELLPASDKQASVDTVIQSSTNSSATSSLLSQHKRKKPVVNSRTGKNIPVRIVSMREAPLPNPATHGKTLGLTRSASLNTFAFNSHYKHVTPPTTPIQASHNRMVDMNNLKRSHSELSLHHWNTPPRNMDSNLLNSGHSTPISILKKKKISNHTYDLMKSTIIIPDTPITEYKTNRYNSEEMLNNSTNSNSSAKNEQKGNHETSTKLIFLSQDSFD